MLELPWHEIYTLPRKTTLESKAREFQYKLSNRIVYTDKILHKIGKTQHLHVPFVAGLTNPSSIHSFTVSLLVVSRYW